MEVLTNVPGKPGGFWHAHTRLVGPTAPHPLVARLIGAAWATRLKDVAVALNLFWRRGPGRCFVTGGGLDGLTFALLQTLFAWRVCPHVMVDCNWYEPPTRLGRWLRGVGMRLAARSVQHFVVWATHELDDYVRAFGLPAAKLCYVPFHTTLDFYQFEVRDDGYLFAGGNYDRDYPTLVEAVRPLDVPVWIATTRPEQLAGTAIPEHVRVAGTTAAGFREALAAARLVVVPMQPGLLHSGGQQTCLNAMYLGKPTIAVGRRWAADLMDDGVHGLIVDYGDVAGLRRAIAWVLDHPEDARQLALRGQEHALAFTTRRCMETIYDLARGTTAARPELGARRSDLAARTAEEGRMIWLLVGYLFLVIYRPFEIWPALGVIRLELLYMIGVGFVWLVTPNKRLALSPTAFGIAGMVLAVLLCALASPWADDCLNTIEPWLKLQVFVLMLLTVVHDEADLKRLTGAILGVMALYMLHSLWEFHGGRHVNRMGINRLVGVDSTNGDPNAFAFTVLLSLIFVPVFWKTWGPGPWRWALAGYAALGVFCINFTGSRTGFAGLIILAVIVGWHSEQRLKVMLTLVVLAPLGFLALPPELQQRFETIVNPDAGPANARTSADGRLEGLQVGLDLWQKNLLTGVGPGAWRAATGRKLNPHNLLGQVAGELGTVGLAALTGLLLACTMTVRRIRRAYRDHPEWSPDFAYYMSGALGLGVFLLVLGGATGHNLLRPQWMLYAAFLSIIHARVVDRARAMPAGEERDATAAEEWEETAEPVSVGY